VCCFIRHLAQTVSRKHHQLQTLIHTTIINNKLDWHFITIRDVMEPAEICLRWIRTSHFISVQIRMRMQSYGYHANYLQTVLPNRSLQYKKECKTISVFSHYCQSFDVLSLVFDAEGVAVFIVYHFVPLCRPGTQYDLLFLNTKPHSNSTNNCLGTSDGFGYWKIAGF